MPFVTIRNTSGEAQILGLRDGVLVDPDEVIRVEGVLADKQPEDAIVIGEGDEARAYPKSHWTKVGTGKSGEPDVLSPNSSDEEI